ncbi:hypothetical protein ABZP36_026035 [Zizania latifolia]
MRGVVLCASRLAANYPEAKLQRGDSERSNAAKPTTPTVPTLHKAWGVLSPFAISYPNPWLHSVSAYTNPLRTEASVPLLLSLVAASLQVEQRPCLLARRRCGVGREFF